MEGFFGKGVVYEVRAYHEREDEFKQGSCRCGGVRDLVCLFLVVFGLLKTCNIDLRIWTTRDPKPKSRSVTEPYLQRNHWSVCETSHTSSRLSWKDTAVYISQRDSWFRGRYAR
jgi:hypothetical protein